MDRIDATTCKCIKCGEQAEVFWPIVNTEIKAYPYCTKCMKEELEIINEILDDFKENEKD